MLKKLRLRAAILLTIKAYDLIATGEFEKIMTGLTIFRYALVIGPMCKEERQRITDRIEKIVADHQA